MKNGILLAGLMVASSSMAHAQGQISFKTVGTINPVYYTSLGDQSQSELALVSTDGTAGSFGAVSYEIYFAPNGTPLITSGGFPNFSGWTGIAVGPVAYTAPGVINPSITVTLPGPGGSPVQPVEIEVVAYTGTLANPILYGYSGAAFLGANTVTFGGQTTSLGALGWSQSTGGPGANPPSAAVPLTAGSAGFGSIVLVDGPNTPEPSTIAIGALGAAAIFFFRRRNESVLSDEP